MPTPLEIFRAWEQTGRYVHVMQIDRGDLSAANRLTLTDRPYYDKGVGGVKYHHTYPAPIDCIISDLETDERMDGTSFADIVLANGAGRFDDLLRFPFMIGKQFTVLRGDPSWSLMESDYPYKFVEIIRGQIDDVSFRKGTGEVVLKVSPIRYKMDNLLGAPDEPIGFGTCRNVPATLVDSATQQYRFNTIETTDSDTYFVVRDAGVELTITTDYTRVLEDGVFKGLIQLTGGSPAGQLTADLNWSGFTISTPICRPVEIVKQLLIENLTNDYSLESSSFSVEPEVTYCLFMFMNSAGSKLYGYDNASGIFQYTVADPISSATYDGVSHNPGTGYVGAWLDPSDEYLYLAKTTIVELWHLSTPGDISTMTFVSSYNLYIAHEINNIRSIALSDDEGTIWVLSNGVLVGQLYTLTIPTPRTLAGLVHAATNYADEIMGDGGFSYWTLLKSSDSKHLYIGVTQGQIVQIDLPSPDSYVEHVNPRREYLVGTAATADFDSYCIHPDGGRLYVLANNAVTQHDLPEPYLLPRRLISSAYGIEQIYSCGLFYQGQTQIGQIVRDALSAVNFTFSVGALGDIRLGKYISPGYVPAVWERVQEISFADFIGERGSHLVQNLTHPAAYRLTADYDFNFTVQSPSQLSGAVSDDDVEYYGKQTRTSLPSTAVGVLNDYAYPREIHLTGKFAYENPSDFVSSEMATWGTERYEYSLSLKLSSISLLDDFGIGNLVKVSGDWRHPYFTPTPSVIGEITTPGTPENNVPGDFSILVSLFIPIGNPTAIISKEAFNDEAWNFEIMSGGKLRLSCMGPSTSTYTTYTMSAALSDFPIREGSLLWLKVDLDINNGSDQSEATFSYAVTNSIDEPAASEFHVMEAVTAGLYFFGPRISSAPILLDVGIGNIVRAILKDGIDGTVVADFDARRQVSDTTFDSPVPGEIWTMVSWARFLDGYPQMLVIGKKVNWSKNQQILTVFK